MNYLDIILWASAVGLWVWIFVKSINHVAEKQVKKDVQRAHDLAHRRIANELRWCLDRLDAIEAKLKKGKR